MVSARKTAGMEHKICVVTDCRFTGDLLCAFVESECAMPCQLALDAQQLPPLDEAGEGTKYLILIDCHNRDAGSVVEVIRSVTQHTQGRHLLALVDLHGGLDVEKAAISLGVRGFFYSSAGAKTLGKAMASMFDGEMWLERRKIVEFLLANHGVAPPTHGETQVSLTGREKQILSLLRQGASNDKIAQTLKISTHTVKSHLYSAFKKIEVPNRVQAALWASDHKEQLGEIQDSQSS